jgi:hypothetical protein
MTKTFQTTITTSPESKQILDDETIRQRLEIAARSTGIMAFSKGGWPVVKVEQVEDKP